MNVDIHVSQLVHVLLDDSFFTVRSFNNVHPLAPSSHPIKPSPLPARSQVTFLTELGSLPLLTTDPEFAVHVAVVGTKEDAECSAHGICGEQLCRVEGVAHSSIDLYLPRVCMFGVSLGAFFISPSSCFCVESCGLRG